MGPVAQLSTAELLRFLLQVSTLLLLATGLGRLARRWGMPRVVGELLAGVLLGPSLLAHAWPDLSLWLFPRQPAQFHLLDAVAQLGVLLLVGLTGLQLDVTLLRQRKRAVFLVSSSGFVLPLAAGIGCGLLLSASLMAEPGDRPVFAGFIGVALSVSAVPVIAKTLADLELFHRDIGQVILSSAVAEDSLGWLLLTVLAAIAVNGLHGGAIAIAIASIAGLIAVAFLSRPVFRVLLDWTSRSADAGPTVALVIGVLLLAAASTQAMGFEGYLGAFVAGVVLASGGIDHSSLAPLRSAVTNFLAPVFFASAGLRMDLTGLANPATAVAAAVILTVAIVAKFGSGYLGAAASGMPPWEAVAVGAGLNARGVVEVIVATVGLRVGVFNTATYTIIVLVAIVTSLLAPPVMRLAFARIAPTEHEEERKNALELL